MLALKNAGAVIVGKTTTTEYGWKTPGDCPLHGITRNPWNPDHTTGGSSSGAGSAGAACFGPLHIGTDAGGSVRIPAAWCGLVGLKPTFGRIPQWPLGASANVACAGPMTRTVGDCALMLGVLARHDRRDPFSLPDDNRDWRATLTQGVDGLRVGVMRVPGFDAPIDADGIAAVEDAALLLAEAGAIVEEAAVDLPDIRAVFGRVWGVALARLVSLVPDTDRAKLDAGLLEVAAAEGGMTATDFAGAEALRIQAAHAMAALHANYDLLLTPTVPNAPPLATAPTTDPVRALWTQWAPWTFLYNLTRQPAVTVPMSPASNGFAPLGPARSALIPRRSGPAWRLGDRSRPARSRWRRCNNPGLSEPPAPAATTPGKSAPEALVATPKPATPEPAIRTAAIAKPPIPEPRTEIPPIAPAIIPAVSRAEEPEITQPHRHTPRHNTHPGRKVRRNNIHTGHHTHNRYRNNNRADKRILPARAGHTQAAETRPNCRFSIDNLRERPNRTAYLVQFGPKP